MYTEIDEPIEVIARFREGRMEPWAFRRGGRTVRDLTVSLTHKLREGSATIFVISVSDGATSYQLEFNNETLEWRLKEIYAEG